MSRRWRWTGRGSPPRTTSSRRRGSVSSTGWAAELTTGSGADRVPLLLALLTHRAQLVLDHPVGDRAGVALAGEHPDESSHGLVVVERSDAAELGPHQHPRCLDLVVGVDLVEGLAHQLLG